MSLAIKTYEKYHVAKKNSPELFMKMHTLDHLDCHELILRRAKMMYFPTVKELIELEEKSVRTLTVKEILRDKQLDEFADVEKALSFAEGMPQK